MKKNWGKDVEWDTTKQKFLLRNYVYHNIGHSSVVSIEHAFNFFMREMRAFFKEFFLDLLIYKKIQMSNYSEKN